MSTDSVESIDEKEIAEKINEKRDMGMFRKNYYTHEYDHFTQFSLY